MFLNVSLQVGTLTKLSGKNPVFPYGLSMFGMNSSKNQWFWHVFKLSSFSRCRQFSQGLSFKDSGPEGCIWGNLYSPSTSPSSWTQTFQISTNRNFQQVSGEAVSYVPKTVLQDTCSNMFSQYLSWFQSPNLSNNYMNFQQMAYEAQFICQKP